MQFPSKRLLAPVKRALCTSLFMQTLYQSEIPHTHNHHFQGKIPPSNPNPTDRQAKSCIEKVIMMTPVMHTNGRELT